jgi:hypothetical protein
MKTEFIKKLDEIVFNSPRESFLNDCTIQDIKFQKNGHGTIKLTKQDREFDLGVFWENINNNPIFFM